MWPQRRRRRRQWRVAVRTWCDQRALSTHRVGGLVASPLTPCHGTTTAVLSQVTSYLGPTRPQYTGETAPSSRRTRDLFAPVKPSESMSESVSPKPVAHSRPRTPRRRLHYSSALTFVLLSGTLWTMALSCGVAAQKPRLVPSNDPAARPRLRPRPRCAVLRGAASPRPREARQGRTLHHESPTAKPPTKFRSGVALCMIKPAQSPGDRSHRLHARHHLREPAHHKLDQSTTTILCYSGALPVPSLRSFQGAAAGVRGAVPCPTLDDISGTSSSATMTRAWSKAALVLVGAITAAAASPYSGLYKMTFAATDPGT